MIMGQEEQQFYQSAKYLVKDAYPEFTWRVFQGSTLPRRCPKPGLTMNINYTNTNITTNMNINNTNKSNTDNKNNNAKPVANHKSATKTLQKLMRSVVEVKWYLV